MRLISMLLRRSFNFTFNASLLVHMRERYVSLFGAVCWLSNWRAVAISSHSSSVGIWHCSAGYGKKSFPKSPIQDLSLGLFIHISNFNFTKCKTVDMSLGVSSAASWSNPTAHTRFMERDNRVRICKSTDFSDSRQENEKFFFKSRISLKEYTS